MNWLEVDLVEKTQRFMDLAAFRQKLVVANIANIDTPNYRTRDIDFRNELRRAAAGFTSDAVGPHVLKVAGLLERPDGNNVNMDRESMLLAETQLQFRVAVQFLRQQFHTLLAAIKEGSP